MRKWLVINRRIFDWIDVVLVYVPVVEVVLDEKGRGVYYGIRGDILAYGKDI